MVSESTAASGAVTIRDVNVAGTEEDRPPWASLETAAAAALAPDVVLERLGVGVAGLATEAVARRRAVVGPNAVRTHQARWWVVLGRQLRSALLLLLAITALVSFFVGDRSDAAIIGVILLISVGLGFVNELRAELAAQALHSQIRHDVVVRRDGHIQNVEITQLVPGDVVRLAMGGVVPADVRVLTADGLECDESVLTGESLPAEKSPAAVATGTDLAERSACAYMGTIVRAGAGEGVVVATGGRTEFGQIALGLGERQEQTEFQAGLRQFSVLLVRVAGVLTTSIFAINVLLSRPLLESLLFSLAIAVGITPQLLPAVVTTSLAAGSRRLARKKVLVKRLVCIEDLGDIEVLLTDKTGTLTEGRITFERAIDAQGATSSEVLRFGLVCNEAVVERGVAVAGNPLDMALWETGASATDDALPTRLGILPFDHDRRMTSVVIDDPAQGRLLVTKGAPESVLARCAHVSRVARQTLDAEFSSGGRVVAVAWRRVPGMTAVVVGDEVDLTLAGYLVFLDRPKADAAASLERLAELGITVKVVTGDNPAVAAKVCKDLGLAVVGALSGGEIEALDDDALRRRVLTSTIFARVSPDQKARLVRAHRNAGHDVAFLGDGVNDAVALHAADVGISVDSGADVAKDAADIVLLEKDLDVLAEGVAEGRRTFANTVKYVLMGTSSNFGNMFSAAIASTFLSFLPMLPSQILLNNLLYDSSQMTIPSDRVDPEMVARPSHWDIRFIRRFMLFFGPISSLFDFATFALMLWVFHAGPSLFRAGWFVESLATQTLVVFVIRTCRVPFWRSRPSRAMLLGVFTVVAVGAYLPYSPAAGNLGFRPLPAPFFVALAAMVALYLSLVEFAKRRFFEHGPSPALSEANARVAPTAASPAEGIPLEPSRADPHAVPQVENLISPPSVRLTCGERRRERGDLRPWMVLPTSPRIATCGSCWLLPPGFRFLLAYGGTEAVVDRLARGLAAEGHEVLLCATGDSTCPVPTRWIYPEGQGIQAGLSVERRHLEHAYEVADEFDLVHDHTVLGPNFASSVTRTPVVTTNHGPFDREMRAIFGKVAQQRTPIIAISRSQARSAADIPIAAVIHHGIDVEQFPFAVTAGDYSLFLGRMSPVKGVDRAARAAHAAGERLVIAAKMREPAEIRYFEQCVEPLLDDRVVFVGEVGGAEKLQLLANARALINPISWPEPFGLVMIEALACGTPVLTFPCGAAPEIVQHGLTGFLCADEEQIAERLADVDALERAACRRSAVDHFSTRRMVSEHLDLYRMLLDRATIAA